MWTNPKQRRKKITMVRTKKTWTNGRIWKNSFQHNTLQDFSMSKFILELSL